MADVPIIGVALKWVPLHVEVDALSGAVATDVRFAGCSAADQAALEWGLQLASAVGGDVVVATVGPAAAEGVLRDALACGAARAARVPAEHGGTSDQVAQRLATVFARASFVCCGDHSLDRGSGSVPAHLAAELGAMQALGLVRLQLPEDATDGTVVASRRLDHGRREILEVRGPAVLSFEGGTAELRRASLRDVLTARDATIDRVDAAFVSDERVQVMRHTPYRPRARVLPPPPLNAPPRDRILDLIGGMQGDDVHARELVEATPAEAADLILERLRAWGYVGHS